MQIQDPSKTFQIKTLSQCNLDQIYMLLNENYMTDQMNILRYSYGKDFLKWYMRIAHPDLIIGLTHNKLLVGIVIGLILSINPEKTQIVYINFLCIHNKLRKHGLAKMLMTEIEKRINLLGIHNTFFHNINYIPRDSHTSLYKVIIPDITHYVIPINYSKLKKLQFVAEEETIKPITSNPLHLIQTGDLKEIATRLNKYSTTKSFHMCFDESNTNLFLKCRKNICYSFANYKDKIPVDFVNVYKHYYYVTEHRELITIAQLGFYYLETITLTDLITYLVDKLYTYGFDQLVFKQISDNDTINITKFSTYDKSTYFIRGSSDSSNFTDKDISGRDINILPI